jgi:hypothetical protein
VLDEEQDDSAGKQEEDELGERIRRADIPCGVHDRGRYEQE